MNQLIVVIYDQGVEMLATATATTEQRLPT